MIKLLLVCVKLAPKCATDRTIGSLPILSATPQRHELFKHSLVIDVGSKERVFTAMPSPMPTPLGSNRFCWICGKAVSAENRKIDEHGSAVHDEFYEARKRLKEGGSPKGRQLLKTPLVSALFMKLCSTW